MNAHLNYYYYFNFLACYLGLRSGEITPNSLNTTSRPGSAMSSSTSGSAVVLRRSLPTQSRRPRPASIAVTGVNLAKEGKYYISLGLSSPLSLIICLFLSNCIYLS